MSLRKNAEIDELWMLKCLLLAEKGAGYVSPNPMVGAIIVKNGKVLGQGYHEKFGGEHAEVVAIRSAKRNVKGATLYVNLEPCSHFGKTPPCTDIIISSGIRRVIIGMKDPNPLVSGRGIAKLRGADIEVIVGVLEKECEKFNNFFVKFIKKQLPYVTLKIAQTLDGKIADVKGKSKWITDIKSRQFVHKMRSYYDAVMIGARTVVRDNPYLNTRLVLGRDPIRVILSKNLSVNPKSRVFSNLNGGKAILYTCCKKDKGNAKKSKLLKEKGVEVIRIPKFKDSSINLRWVLKDLAGRGVASVLVEGGATIFSAFIQNKLADKVIFFISSKILGNGINSFNFLKNRTLNSAIKLDCISTYLLGKDVIIEGYVKN